MRKFIVNVNGSSYEVEVEEIAAGAAPVAGSRAMIPKMDTPQAATASNRFVGNA